MASSRKRKGDARCVRGKASEERKPVGGKTSEKEEPVGCCKAFSFVHKDHFYVCQGQDSRHDGHSEDQLLPLQRYDFTPAQWRGVSPVCVDDEPEEKKFTREFTVDGGVCCTVLGNCAFTIDI